MGLGIDLSPLKALRESREPVVIVLDSTGVRLVLGWRGSRRRDYEAKGIRPQGSF